MASRASSGLVGRCAASAGKAACARAYRVPEVGREAASLRLPRRLPTNSRNTTGTATPRGPPITPKGSGSQMASTTHMCPNG